MTDTNVRNVLFDPRCGWVLISNGVYLGTSKVVGRANAMQVLSRREIYYGLRGPVASRGERTPASIEAMEALKEARNALNHRDKAYDRMRRERKG